MMALDKVSALRSWHAMGHNKALLSTKSPGARAKLPVNTPRKKRTAFHEEVQLATEANILPHIVRAKGITDGPLAWFHENTPSHSKDLCGPSGENPGYGNVGTTGNE